MQDHNIGAWNMDLLRMSGVVARLLYDEAVKAWDTLGGLRSMDPTDPCLGRCLALCTAEGAAPAAGLFQEVRSVCALVYSTPSIDYRKVFCGLLCVAVHHIGGFHRDFSVRWWAQRQSSRHS